MKALLHLDMGFFYTPWFYGNYYGKQDYVSETDHRSKVKNWLHVEDWLKKMNIEERYKGSLFAESRQTLLYWNNYFTKYPEDKGKITLLHMSPHHNAYNYVSADYYLDKELSRFKNFEYIIGAMREGMFSKVVWVTPDYFTQEDFNSQFDNCAYATYGRNYYKMDFLTEGRDKKKDFTFNINLNKWDDLKIENYDIGYFTVALNKNITMVNESDNIKLLKDKITEKPI